MKHDKDKSKKEKYYKNLAAYGVGMLCFSFITGILLVFIFHLLLTDIMFALMLIIPAPIPVFLLWGFFRKTYYNYHKLKEIMPDGRILPV